MTDSFIGKTFYYNKAIFSFTIVYSKNHSKVILILGLFLGYFANVWYKRTKEMEYRLNEGQ
ncbi:MAG: hypothetical protein RI965_1709 [Bacteroidota bacterium]|jgi:hypothetical protein